MKKLIKPTPTPGIREKERFYDRAAESVYFLELFLFKLGIGKNLKPMSVHTFARRHFRV